MKKLIAQIFLLLIVFLAFQRNVYAQPCSITQQPTDQSVCPGTQAVFSVVASFGPSRIESPGIYQWEKLNVTSQQSVWVPITGATSSNYTIDDAQPGMNGQKIRCIVSGFCEPIISAIATLYIDGYPFYDNQVFWTGNQLVQGVCPGMQTTFSVSVRGSGITYQWQTRNYSRGPYDWENIDGATSSYYIIPPAVDSMRFSSYRCIVSGPCGTYNSEEVFLHIGFTNVIIDSYTGDQVVCENNPVSFSVQAEPFVYEPYFPSYPINYSWQVSEDGGHSWVNVGAGGLESTYTIPHTTNAMNGFKYRCVMKGGDIACEAATLAATLTVVPLSTIITQQPQNTQTCPGYYVSFITGAQDGSHYQWQVAVSGSNTWKNISGAKYYIYSISSATSSMHGNRYRCMITSSCGTVASESAVLTVHTLNVTISQQPANQYTYHGSSATFSVSAVHALSYQWQQSTNGGAVWTNIPSANSSVYTIPQVTANMNGNKFRCVLGSYCLNISYSNSALLTVSPVRVGHIVSLRGSNSNFVSSENSIRPMWCNRSNAQPWEYFTIVDAGGGKVALMNGGKYVTSENGTAPISCNRTTIGAWEKFDLIVNTDGSLSLKGNNGRYVSSENGQAAMTCNRTAIGLWEKFNWLIVGWDLTVIGTAKGGVPGYTMTEQSTPATMTSGSLAVYPNPVTNKLNVRIPDIQGPAVIRVFDMYGKMVMQRSSSQVNTQLDLSAFASGMYVIRVINDGKESMMKIVKD